jgi:hypothetical protein
MYKMAIDTCPESLPLPGSHELAKICILTGIKGAEAMGTILVREVMAGVIFAI